MAPLSGWTWIIAGLVIAGFSGFVTWRTGRLKLVLFIIAGIAFIIIGISRLSQTQHNNQKDAVAHSRVQMRTAAGHPSPHHNNNSRSNHHLSQHSHQHTQNRPLSASNQPARMTPETHTSPHPSRGHKTTHPHSPPHRPQQPIHPHHSHTGRSNQPQSHPQSHPGNSPIPTAYAQGVCPACRSAISNNARYCMHCGTRVR